MKTKGIIEEDFINFKYPSLYISTAYCDFKCDKESGKNICQNSLLTKQKNYTIADDNIIQRYLNNNITKSIVFGGLEPFEQFDELYQFIKLLRCKYKCMDTVVIYTGFNKDEIQECLNKLKPLQNIIIKFGRFIPNQNKHFDNTIGVYLASDNQYAEYI